MARYIDADKFTERIKVSPAFPNMGFEGYFLRNIVLDLLDNAPTADVAPKSEVDWHREAELNAQRIIELEAELQAMRGAANSYKMHYENAKAEAIKDFAMRLKNAYTNKRYDKPNAHTLILYLFDKIDNLVKEMTRRCPDCKHFVGCETACGGMACDMYDEDKKG